MRQAGRRQGNGLSVDNAKASGPLAGHFLAETQNPRPSRQTEIHGQADAKNVTARGWSEGRREDEKE